MGRWCLDREEMKMFGSEIVQILQKAGLILKHMLGVVLLAWRRMARAGLISWGVGFILVELIGSLIAHQFSGPVLALTSVVALIFASMVAYSVMLTVLIEELFLGAINTVRVLEGDIEGGARALAVASERKAGEAGSGIMRWLGHATSNREAKAGTVTYAPISETQADIEATDEFTSTMPRPRVNARPVSAGQLPRIGWALEQLEPVEHVEAPTIADAHVDDAALPAAPQGSATADPSPAITRPLATSQPLAEGERSIWSRISKTLVGNVHPPLVDEQEIDSAAGASAEEDSTVN
jgi:hypothetical protein